MKNKLLIITIMKLYEFRLFNNKVEFRKKESDHWHYLDDAAREKVFIAVDAEINSLKTVWRFCYSDLDLAILQILQNGDNNR